MIRLRQPIESDWKPISEVLDTIVPGDEAGNRSWVENRRCFDESSGRRRQYTVEEDGTVTGYGCAEASEDDPGWFRMHICVANDRLVDPIADDLHAKLWSDLHDLGAAGAWAREWATLTDVADFFVRLGYVETRRSSTGGRGIIVWKKPLSGAHPLR